MQILKRIITKRKHNRTKFGQIAEEWLNMKKGRVKQSTYLNYKYEVYKYLMPTFKEYTLKKIEKYNFNVFVENLNSKYSSKTVQDINVKLKSILKYANSEYDANIKTNSIIMPKTNNEPLTILSKQEKNKLQKYCIKDNSLESIGILMALNTGMRIGEICALKWKNIDLEKGEIRVRKTMQRVYFVSINNTKVIIDTPKSHKSIRNIPISNKLLKLLKQLQKKYKKSDFFLTGNEEKYIEPRCYLSIYKRILKKSKIKKKYKFHILRHTFATNCIEVGMDAKSLSEILGHSSVEITLNKYVHSSYKNKKRFLEKI